VRNSISGAAAATSVAKYNPATAAVADEDEFAVFGNLSHD